MVPEMTRFHQWWGRMWIDLLARQQAFFASQFSAAVKLLEAGDEQAASIGDVAPADAQTGTLPQRPSGDADRSPESGPRTEGDRVARLVENAQARMREGFPPPREIYQIQNRDKIDWTVFPDWARPVSPELYDGCSHEG